MAARWDLLSGLASAGVTVVVGVVTTPIYLRLLGAEGYGVHAFFLTLQACLLSLDAGLAVHATREVARGESRIPLARLVTALSGIAWGAGLAFALALAAVSSPIARHWLQLTQIDPAVAAQALAIGGIAICARWPIAFYQGVLAGRHRLAESNVANIVTVLASAAVAVAALSWVSADVRLLLAVIAIAGTAQSLWLRSRVKKALWDPRPAPSGALRHFFRSAAPVGVIGIVGLLILQVDKITLSAVLAVSGFGHYMIAAVPASALYAVVMPVFNVALARLSALAAPGHDAGLLDAYRETSLVLAVLMFPLAGVLSCFAEPVLLAWTANPAVAEESARWLRWLAVGSAMYGIMFMPYALQLAMGAGRLAARLSATLLALSIPVTIALVSVWGADGAAIAWLIVNAVYLLGGSTVTHRLLLPAAQGRWLARDLAPPAALAAAVMGAGGAAARAAALSPWESVGLAAALVPTCWGISAVASTRLRRRASRWWQARGR